MGAITLGQAAKWCGGAVEPKYEKVTFFGANNDSRKIRAGELFVALKDVRDGHDFIPKALENGAAAALCSRCEGDYPAIVVEDTRIALGEIARGYRESLDMKVVAVTGSVGKSTTKEMIAWVLSQAFRVGRTPANHNNDIGMPMAVLALEPDTQVAVLEMGMNHLREIAYLTDIARPDYGVIINIGTMHIEHLGSQEGILTAKLEITEGMTAEAPLFLNGDDPYLRMAHDRVTQPITYFGGASDCQVRAEDVREKDGHITFTVCYGEASFPVCLNLEGLHHVPDAMAALSVGLALGVKPERIAQALATFRNMEGRQEIFEAKGYTIIKDCYNAGPESMAAALAVLGNRTGRKIAVLGDMLELGICAEAEHYKIGRIAAEKADLLLAYGPNGERMVSGAITGGMKNPAWYMEREKLAQDLKRIVRPGDVLLFKGSHGMRMELALELFLKEET